MPETAETQPNNHENQINTETADDL